MNRKMVIKFVAALIVGLFLIVIVLVNLFGDKPKEDFFDEENYIDEEDSFELDLEELLKDLEEEDTTVSNEEEEDVKPVENDSTESETVKETIDLKDQYTLAMDDYGFHEEYSKVYIEKYGEEKMEELYITASKVAKLWFARVDDWNVWQPFVTTNYLTQLKNVLPSEKKKVNDVVVHLTDPSTVEDRIIIGAVGLNGDKQEMLEVVFEPVGDDYFVSAIAVIWSDL